MTDGEVRAEDVDGLDAAWDDLILGRVERTSAAIDASDVVTLRALAASVDVPPPVGRRIWTNAFAKSSRSHYRARQRAATPGGWPIHLVAPATFGWGWLPAGAVAVTASVAILAGILLGQNDGNGVTATLPSADASSVVATLPSSAPAWATPSTKSAD
jgi:hypothetical protein